MARRSLWRWFRRATRGPRNALLARAIHAAGRVIGGLPPFLGLGIGRALGSAAYLVLARPRRLALEHLGIAFPDLDAGACRRLARSTFRHALRRGRIIALLIDQDTRGAGVFVPFFGRLAHTPSGAALLALRARVPVITAFIQRRPGGGHLVRMAAVPLGEGNGRGRVTELTARFTAAIEAQIRRAPAEWVWWHERWRRQPA